MSKSRQVVEVKRNQLAPQLLVLSVSASPRLHSCQMLSLRQRRRQTARLCQRLQPRQPRSCYFRGTAPPHRIRSSSPVQAETITDLRKLDEHLSTRTARMLDLFCTPPSGPSAGATSLILASCIESEVTPRSISPWLWLHSSKLRAVQRQIQSSEASDSSHGQMFARCACSWLSGGSSAVSDDLCKKGEACREPLHCALPGRVRGEAQ